MAKTPTKAPKLADGTDPAEMAESADAGGTAPVETTENQSDTEVGAGEPVEQSDTTTTDRNTDPVEDRANNGDKIAQNDQMKSPQNEDGTRSYDKVETTTDEDAAKGEVSVGKGSVVGDGATVQSFVEGGDAADTSKGDGVTGKSNDGATYQVEQANTGTTPLAPKPSTANELIAGLGFPPAKVEEHTLHVFDGLRGDTSKSMAHGVNIFDNTGFNRSELPALANALNEHFGIAITVGECQNFMIWQDVTNCVKRKLATKEAVAQAD